MTSLRGTTTYSRGRRGLTPAEPVSAGPMTVDQAPRPQVGGSQQKLRAAPAARCAAGGDY